MAEPAVELSKVLASVEKYNNTHLIWGTAAYFGLAPFRSDFIGYVEGYITLKDATKGYKVIVIRAKIRKMVNFNANYVISHACITTF